MNSAVMVPFGLVVLTIAVIAATAALTVTRTRRRARQRVVEAPNSHYTSQLVRNGETRHRWHSIALDQVHEINRPEVERLLARVEAAGVDALRPAERVFLDQLAQLPGAEGLPERLENNSHPPPELRQHPV